MTYRGQAPAVAPVSYRLCPACKGHGVTSPAWAFSGDEWDLLGQEEQDAIREGAYARTCGTCGGERVVRADRDVAAEREERRAERRWEALESGDVELYLNPDL